MVYFIACNNCNSCQRPRLRRGAAQLSVCGSRRGDAAPRRTTSHRISTSDDAQTCTMRADDAHLAAWRDKIHSIPDMLKGTSKKATLPTARRSAERRARGHASRATEALRTAGARWPVSACGFKPLRAAARQTNSICERRGHDEWPARHRGIGRRRRRPRGRPRHRRAP